MKCRWHPHAIGCLLHEQLVDASRSTLTKQYQQRRQQQYQRQPPSSRSIWPSGCSCRRQLRCSQYDVPLTPTSSFSETSTCSRRGGRGRIQLQQQDKDGPVEAAAAAAAHAWCIGPNNSRLLRPRGVIPTILAIVACVALFSTHPAPTYYRRLICDVVFDYSGYAGYSNWEDLVDQGVADLEGRRFGPYDILPPTTPALQFTDSLINQGPATSLRDNRATTSHRTLIHIF